ncbi:MAG: biopolymer transporter ExbD [Alphaproteobacteria bacterium]|nr:biopolymer transporter ExbD [Alphaproteobacteria bacterium]
MDFERQRRLVSEINLTALIDIVFHLMVFVMLTTSFVVSESMELSLPSGKAPPAHQAERQVLRIQIAGDGTVLVDHQPMGIDQMSGVLGDRIAAAPEISIAIFTTAGVSVQQLISVMDAVYLTGGRNVQVDKV